MNRSTWTHFVLLGIALAAAYQSWSSEDTLVTDDGVVIVSTEASELSVVKYESSDKRLTMTFKADSQGSYIWVDSVEMKQSTKPKALPAAEDSEENASSETAEAPPSPEPVVTEELKSFKAGSAGQGLIDKLAPFTAKRELVDVGSEGLAALGLVEPEGTLTLERNNKAAVVIEVGGEAYGTRDRYVRDKTNGRIYIVAADVLRPMEHANTRLPDRDLLASKQPELVHLLIETQTGSAEFEQRNRDDRKAAYWARTNAEAEDTVATGWLDRFFRLRSRGYVQVDETPTGLEPQFTVKTIDENGDALALEILSGNNENGQPSFYAKSDHTRELVKLDKTLASETTEDLSAVITE
ncbi:MAG: DUF4340 domain-containing protein [Myxococcota bacterium]|nr:DUF4340 domain-containing protein [Myxococcota bacterium]